MGAYNKELRAFVFLMLASLSVGKPLEKAKRAIVKDYFDPLTYHTDKLQFEKADDGKFYEKKNDGPLISEVEYVIAHGINENNGIFGEHSNTSDQSLQDKKVVVANSEKADLTAVSPIISEVEHQKASPNLSAEVLTPDKYKLEAKDANLEKAIAAETTVKLDPETKSDDITSKHGGSAKLDIPLDSKWALVPKPDGKDDKSYEGGEDYVPEPPIIPENKNDGEKVEIGQIPKHHPVFFPPNIPLLIPQILSFRGLSLLPKPPALDISDRLPLPEPEVFEESSETAVVENISPGGSKVVKEGRQFLPNHLIDPMRFGLQIPFLHMPLGSKDAIEEEKFKGMINSKIVNIGGHKMLLQKNILLSPRNNPSPFHISVMSLQPLDDVDPKILKDLDTEKKEIESEDTSLKKDLSLVKNREAENRSHRKDIAIEQNDEKRSKVFPEFKPKPEIFDAKKPKVVEGKAVEHKKPPTEALIPKIPLVKREKDEKKEEIGKEKKIVLDGETKTKDEGREESTKSQVAKELGLKTDIKIKSKADEKVEKGKGMEIATFVPPEIIKKKNLTVVVKMEEDELIGTEDLLKFRGQAKSQNPTIAHPTTADVIKGDFEFEKDSPTIDVEAAQSKRVEVTLRPAEESKYNPEKVITEGKKGDEGLLNAEKVAAPKSGTEFVSSAVAKEPTEILKAESKYFEKAMPEEKKVDDMNENETVFSHRDFGIPTKQVDKEKPDIKNKKSKELGEKSEVEGKKEADDTFSSENDSRRVKEIEAAKESKEKIDIMKSGPKELDDKSMIKGKQEVVDAPKEISHDVREIARSKETLEQIDIKKAFSEEPDEKSMGAGKRGDDGILIAEEASQGGMEILENKEKIDIRNLQRSEESGPKIEGLDIKKAEGAILEER